MAKSRILYSFTALALVASIGLASLQAQTPANQASRQSGNAVSGERMFAQCRACHKIDASGTSGMGPNLYRVVGRRSGTYPGFRYSTAMMGANRVWTEAALDAYLASPAKSLPGGRMAYAGLRNPDDRKALIAYLKSASR